MISRRPVVQYREWRQPATSATSHESYHPRPAGMVIFVPPGDVRLTLPVRVLRLTQLSTTFTEFGLPELA